MNDYKIWLGYLSVVIALGSYVPYFWGIYKGRIKPHGFTWIVWTVLTGVGFVAQLVSGGGAGSWLMAVYALLCAAVALIAIKQGHVKYVLFDWLSLGGGLTGIILWILTDNPLTAVVLVSLSDIIALLPTVRKVYSLPNEESVIPWTYGIVTHVISIFALEALTITTWLYPTVIIFVNSLFVALVFIRRRQLK